MKNVYKIILSLATALVVCVTPVKAENCKLDKYRLKITGISNISKLYPDIIISQSNDSDFQKAEDIASIHKNYFNYIECYGKMTIKERNASCIYSNFLPDTVDAVGKPVGYVYNCKDGREITELEFCANIDVYIHCNDNLGYDNSGYVYVFQPKCKLPVGKYFIVFPEKLPGTNIGKYDFKCYYLEIIK